MLRNKMIGMMLSVIMVISALIAIVPLESDADSTDPYIWGYVGISGDTEVDQLDARGGITVVLYKAFDLFGMEEVGTFTTSSGDLYDFTVSPGYYMLGIEPKIEGDKFYHINEVVYPDGIISLGKIDYTTNNITEVDIPLVSEDLNAHFFGQITDGGFPVQGAVVTIEDPLVGYEGTDTTNTLGEYSIDVYSDTFDMIVSLDDDIRYYGSVTATDIANVNETFELANTVYDNIYYNLNLGGGNIESFVWGNDTVSNLTVLNLTNGLEVTVDYYNGTRREKNITDDYYANQSHIELGGRVAYDVEVYHNGTQGDYSNWTLLENGTDYKLDYVNGILNITSTLNNYTFVNYTRLYEQNEALGFVGRNIEDRDISSNTVAWLAKDGAVPLSTDVDVHAVFFNKGTKDVYSKTTGRSFNITIPDGNYVVVIRPDGYGPYVDTNLIVSGNDSYNTSFDPLSDQSTVSTHFEFNNGDWNNLTITKTTIMNSYDHLPGLGENLQNIRMQIDDAYGDGDGTLDIAEVTAFENDMENNKHPEDLSTDDIIEFNGTSYLAVDGTYDVTLEVPDLTTSISVNDTRPVTLTIDLTYGSNEDIPMDEDEYLSTLYLSVEDIGEYRISLPATYARRGNAQELTTNVPTGPGKVDVVIDVTDIWAPVPLDIGRISSPVAEIDVLSTPILSKENNNVFLVNVSTVIPFDGADSYVENGSIVQYMWDWGDGSPSTGWQDNSSATHNFTTSYPDGRDVTLSVRDSAGQESTATVKVVPDGQAPIAIIDANLTWVGQGELIEFNASGSSDGVVSEFENLTFKWDFNDTATSTTNVSYHSYSQPGTYTVTLNVTDEVGNTGTSTVAIHVNDTTPPNAMIVSVRNVAEDTLVSFNGTTSFDGEGNITNYTWDFGDGAIAYGVVANHAYADPGDYDVALNVTDEMGIVGTMVIRMNVFSGPRPNIELVSIEIVGDVVNGKETTVNIAVRNIGTANCTLPITITLMEGTIALGTATVDPLVINEEGTASIKWTPNYQGSHVLTANATSEEDSITYNNVKAENISVEPNLAQAYGTTILIVLAVIALLVVILARDKIKDVIAASAEAKKEKAKQAEKEAVKKAKEEKRAQEKAAQEEGGKENVNEDSISP